MLTPETRGAAADPDVGNGPPDHKHRRSHARFRGLALTIVAVLTCGLAVTAVPVGVETAKAAFSTGGTGNYREAIDWVVWGEHGDRLVSGAKVENTLDVAGQALTTTCTITNVSGNIQAYRPGTWKGDLFDDLYNIGGTGGDNQLIAGISNVNEPDTVSFRFSCSATLDFLGTKRVVPLDGLVFADAEASNWTDSQKEYIKATTTEDVTWRLLDEESRCQTNAMSILEGRSLTLRPDNAECGEGPGGGPVAVAFMEGATSADIELRGGGKSAIALGVVLQTDFGDAPASYGAAGSLLSPTWTDGVIPNGEFNLTKNGTVATIASDAAPRLGDKLDADAVYTASSDALADDKNAVTDDEDAIEPLGAISVVPGGENWTLKNVKCVALKEAPPGGGVGYVAGWLDWNNNGKFDDGEMSGIEGCDSKVGSVDLTWQVPLDASTTPQDELTFLRLRTGVYEAGVSQRDGMTIAGEIEDHALRVRVPHLHVEKTSNATTASRPGHIVTYTVKATNAAAVAFPANNPAVLLDDMTGILDDAVYNRDATANRPGDISYSEPLLKWTGVLAAHETVELTYSVTLGPDGDGNLRNVAWEPKEPDDPTTPECTPAGDGNDPGLGHCASAELLLPRLAITKTADRPELSALRQEVEFSVTVTNTGPGDYTTDTPASFTDDLSDVLDDATLILDSITSPTGAVQVAGDKLNWSGPLAAGNSATVTYRVTYTGAGDRVVSNIACVPEVDVAPGAARCGEVEIHSRTYAIGDTVRGSHGDVSEPMPGVAVELLDADGKVLAETETDAEGRYLFDGLYTGDYRVRFTLTDKQAALYRFDSGVTEQASPAVAVTDVFALDATNTALTHDYTAQQFTASEGIDPSRDASLVRRTYAVGDVVWVDTDGDGVQGDSEAFPGMDVELLDADGNVLAETVTDANGRYLFDGLLSGDYRIRFSTTWAKNAIYTFIPQDVGGDDAADSDADTETGTTVVFTLDLTNTALTHGYADQVFTASEGIDPSWDAGLSRRPFAISSPLPAVGGEGSGALNVIGALLAVCVAGLVLRNRRTRA